MVWIATGSTSSDGGDPSLHARLRTVPIAVGGYLRPAPARPLSRVARADRHARLLRQLRLFRQSRRAAVVSATGYGPAAPRAAARASGVHRLARSAALRARARSRRRGALDDPPDLRAVVAAATSPSRRSSAAPACRSRCSRRGRRRRRWWHRRGAPPVSTAKERSRWPSRRVEWVGVLRRLLDSPERRATLAVRGRRRLSRRYSPEAVRARDSSTAWKWQVEPASSRAQSFSGWAPLRPERDASTASRPLTHCLSQRPARPRKAGFSMLSSLDRVWNRRRSGTPFWLAPTAEEVRSGTRRSLVGAR